MERLLASKTICPTDTGRTASEVDALLSDARPWLFRLALSIVGDADGAEDVTQETLVRAAQSRKKLAHVEDVQAWLRKVAVRRAITYVQRQRPAGTGDSPTTSDPTESIAVREALRRLAPTDRAILSLAHFEMLSYAEIAQVLDIPMGTVASRLHSAREAFRREWQR